jgi:uncharacterized protein YbaA (DUF1428 family)
MPYVDGFVLVVPKKKVKAYVAMAKKAAPIFKEHGALEVRECCGEDLAVKMGRGFPKMTGMKRGETVFFSWITYASKKARDRCNAKIMKDPRMLAMCGPDDMPFDLAKMAYGGFDVVVKA